MFKQLAKLIALSKGNPVAVLETADAASGGHVEKFFKTSQEKFGDASDQMVRDGFLEMSKLVQYNGTAIRVMIEILTEVLGNEDVTARFSQAWGASTEEPPELRDVIVGAAQIVSAYASTTRPIRHLYLDALRGSYSPEIFTFGFGPELLDALIDSRLIPSDIDVLRELVRQEKHSFKLLPGYSKIDACERLATVDFIEMHQDQRARSSDRVLFIKKRTDAASEHITARPTMKGRRLLNMIDAGRGKGPTSS